MHVCADVYVIRVCFPVTVHPELSVSTCMLGPTRDKGEKQLSTKHSRSLTCVEFMFHIVIIHFTSTEQTLYMSTG